MPPEVAEKIRQEKREARLEESNLPRRYRRVRRERLEVDGHNREAFRTADLFLGDLRARCRARFRREKVPADHDTLPYWIVFEGSGHLPPDPKTGQIAPDPENETGNGTGKSMLAAWMVCEATRFGAHPFYINEFDLYERLKVANANVRVGLGRMITQFLRYDFVVVDDLGKMVGRTPFRDSAFFAFFNAFWSEGGILVVTTNCTWKGVGQVLSQDILTRINGECWRGDRSTWHVLTGPDRRALG